MFKTRQTVVAALVSSALIASVGAAQATTPADSSVVRVDRASCPYPSTGYVLDFWYGDPPRHLFTVRLCSEK